MFIYQGLVLMIDERLLDILVCPVSKTRLIYDNEKQELISKGSNLAYPVRDGIPIMLVDEARVIQEGIKDDSEFE